MHKNDERDDYQDYMVQVPRGASVTAYMNDSATGVRLRYDKANKVYEIPQKYMQEDIFRQLGDVHTQQMGSKPLVLKITEDTDRNFCTEKNNERTSSSWTWIGRERLKSRIDRLASAGDTEISLTDRSAVIEKALFPADIKELLKKSECEGERIKEKSLDLLCRKMDFYEGRPQISPFVAAAPINATAAFALARGVLSAPEVSHLVAAGSAILGSQVLGRVIHRQTKIKTPWERMIEAARDVSETMEIGQDSRKHSSQRDRVR